LEEEKEILFYREFFGPASVTVEIYISEMDGATEVIFHNNLVEKEGLRNTLLIFSQ
jgi:hypothetical protein